VRNHRLWELYLTNAAHIAADHVHEDAEKIEHVLGEEVVRELERRLEYATTDPHGRRIPSLADMRLGGAGPERPDDLVGYGRRS
jgi:manganese/zinc/iron transport system permease protein